MKNIGEGLAFLLVAVVSFTAGTSYQKHRSVHDLQDLAYYRQTNLFQSGWSQGVGSYQLYSLNGGKNWWAVEQTEDGQVEIIGSAEEVFPGLLKRLRAWDDLEEYARENGPLTLSGDRAAIEQIVLEATGSTVKRRDL